MAHKALTSWSESSLNNNSASRRSFWIRSGVGLDLVSSLHMKRYFCIFVIVDRRFKGGGEPARLHITVLNPMLGMQHIKMPLIMHIDLLA